VILNRLLKRYFQRNWLADKDFNRFFTDPGIYPGSVLPINLFGLSYKIYKHNQSIELENGISLPGYHLAYTTYGALNKSGDNVIWVFHALTANSDPAEWWPGLVGKGKLFDPSRYFIVCVNMPGSCYGSIGPLELSQDTAEPYYHDFPLFTTRDMIRAYQPLRKFLGIRKIFVGIGGSMGGQQLLEWAIEEPELFENILPIATNARHSAWGIAFNASQRFCIESDPTWKNRNPHAGLSGMKVARGIALISYRHYDTYSYTQSEDSFEKMDSFKSESYQRYQGEKLAKRFNAFSYFRLSQAMDAHNTGRGRHGLDNSLKMITAKTMVIGISSDILFPVLEQQFLAEHIPGAHLKVIDSKYGHDGFLLEFEQIEELIKEFLFQEKNYYKLEIAK
jgi:homoserine O-acetyltransferase/O-succinyltransferase